MGPCYRKLRASLSLGARDMVLGVGHFHSQQTPSTMEGEGEEEREVRRILPGLVERKSVNFEISSMERYAYL